MPEPLISLAPAVTQTLVGPAPGGWFSGLQGCKPPVTIVLGHDTRMPQIPKTNEMFVLQIETSGLVFCHKYRNWKGT